MSSLQDLKPTPPRPVPGSSELPARTWTIFAAAVLITGLFFLAADRGFPEWMPDGEIVILALGFLFLSRFYTQRKRYQQKYGAGAFRYAFTRLYLPGLGIIVASLAHLAYMSGPGIPDLWWRAWLTGLGWLLVTLGIILVLRAIQAAGLAQTLRFDIYSPEYAPGFDKGIYAILRHPVDVAALEIGLGLALIHANWYSLLVAVLLPLFIVGWLRLIYEPALIAAIPAYSAYRRRVPALLPAPRQVPAFWHRLLLGR